MKKPDYKWIPKGFDFRQFVMSYDDHPGTKTALEKFKKAEIDPPEGLTTKTALYEELQNLGLRPGSPLFVHLFDLYGGNLKLC